MVDTLHATMDIPNEEKKAVDRDLQAASIDELLGVASEVVKGAVAGTKFFNPQNEARVPRFSDREIVSGSIIGRGGFCVVRDIEKIRIQSQSSSFRSSKSNKSSDSDLDGQSKSRLSLLCCGRGRSTSEDSIRMSVVSADNDPAGGQEKLTTERDYKYTRDYVASRSKKTRRNGGRYVIKTVSKDVNKMTYMKGCVDIAMEAKFLSMLDHPNIISLVGVSRSKPCTTGYFLILEKMSETLVGRIKTWMDRDRLSKGCTGIFAGGKKKEHELYVERISASYDIASALFYLHSKDIIYRDLKPANIGFDSNNELKLFDFGLAKELMDKDCNRDGTYRNMTMNTGAIRYMAPEVGRGLPYNLAADVYSWSMVMWFILALEPPFGLYSEDMIVSRVHERGHRPVVFIRWNETIGDLLKRSWHPDLHQRPKMLDIVLALKQELLESEAGGTLAGSVADSIDAENSERRPASLLSRR